MDKKQKCNFAFMWTLDQIANAHKSVPESLSELKLELQVLESVLMHVQQGKIKC